MHTCSSYQKGANCLEYPKGIWAASIVQTFLKGLKYSKMRQISPEAKNSPWRPKMASKAVLTKHNGSKCPKRPKMTDAVSLSYVMFKIIQEGKSMLLCSKNLRKFRLSKETLCTQQTLRQKCPGISEMSHKRNQLRNIPASTCHISIINNKMKEKCYVYKILCEFQVNANKEWNLFFIYLSCIFQDFSILSKENMHDKRLLVVFY